MSTTYPPLYPRSLLAHQLDSNSSSTSVLLPIRVCSWVARAAPADPIIFTIASPIKLATLPLDFASGRWTLGIFVFIVGVLAFSDGAPAALP